MRRLYHDGVSLPSWVNWIAQDSDGSVWGYSVEPLRNDNGWYENEVGQCIRLDHADPTDWKRSLRAVTEGHARCAGTRRSG